ncbi:hypothetical protein PAXINDRAFT_18889 [Paxillus involutus ATCC 200175]|uniref:Helitron helicase-like domain-containing protein n=1 Tax=Paxillus involutus ATCC 200175 TaxID=664439 RepID=A0A0C9SXW8_PAXIN|nr:hypothetical protein PAXINDRAFT_18889 [Paxillus involutus ATCC 200175]
MDEELRAAINNLTVLDILESLRGVVSFSMAERNCKAQLVDRVISQVPADKLEVLKAAGIERGENIGEMRKCKRRRLEAESEAESSTSSMNAFTVAEIQAAMNNLTVSDILESLRGVVSFSTAERNSKSLLIDRAIFELPVEKLEVLKGDGVTRGKEVEEQRNRKRKATHIRYRNKRRRLHAQSEDENSNDSEFLQLPTEEEKRSCYRRFFEATSKEALKSAVCAVCARECGAMDEQLSTWTLAEIPNVKRLIPDIQHPVYDLFDGKLLAPEGIKTGPPRLALANGLWIGRVPWQLQVLTFSEQLLVALLYPRVYVFKLFPKKIAGTRSTENLQRGMRGNICTYELSSPGITSMLQGHLMPRPPSILASLISVTFIGVGKLPKTWMGKMFRVRRHTVSDTLLWLKENNTRYYGSVKIDEQRLAELPEDGVPDEISSIVRQSTDEGLVDQESEGYIPQEDDIDVDGSGDGQCSGTSETQRPPVEGPDVIPLQTSGVLDTDLTNITANELMAWGMDNLTGNGDTEGSYAVRHGTHPVTDFAPLREMDNERSENVFEKAFPCLFPYGLGGIESLRHKGVDFSDHVRWSLRYHDRRFRTHETFPFVAFGILQRRQALTDRLKHAAQEEEDNMPHSDEAVRLLKKHLYATSSRVQGSDQSRYQLRSQIWSTAICMGPPSLWITINPCDLHDPIVQVFAGENVDMDDLLHSVGPDKEQRARNVAQDPYAASKFFHYIINTIFETLFGITAGPFSVTSDIGVVGRVAAYFGTVESQGRAMQFGDGEVAATR